MSLTLNTPKIIEHHLFRAGYFLSAPCLIIITLLLLFPLNSLSLSSFLCLMSKEILTHNLRIQDHIGCALDCPSSLIFYYSCQENLYSKETKLFKLPLNGRYFLAFQDATNILPFAITPLSDHHFLLNTSPSFKVQHKYHHLTRPFGTLSLSPYSSASSLRTSVHTFWAQMVLCLEPGTSRCPMNEERNIEYWNLGKI